MSDDNIWDSFGNRPPKNDYDNINKGLPNYVYDCDMCKKKISKHDYIVFSKDYQFVLCVQCYKKIKNNKFPNDIQNYVFNDMFD